MKTTYLFNYYVRFIYRPCQQLRLYGVESWDKQQINCKVVEVAVAWLKYHEKIEENYQNLSKKGRYAGRHINMEVPTVTSV